MTQWIYTFSNYLAVIFREWCLASRSKQHTWPDKTRMVGPCWRMALPQTVRQQHKCQTLYCCSCSSLCLLKRIHTAGFPCQATATVTQTNSLKRSIDRAWLFASWPTVPAIKPDASAKWGSLRRQAPSRCKWVMFLTRLLVLLKNSNTTCTCLSCKYMPAEKEGGKKEQKSVHWPE